MVNSFTVLQMYRPDVIFQYSIKVIENHSLDTASVDPPNERLCNSYTKLAPVYNRKMNRLCHYRYSR